MYKKHYLVTGGTGFIGSALVHKLVSRGDKVRVLDNGFRMGVDRLASLKNDIECIEGDIRDLAIVQKALKGVEGVFHLAAINGTEFFYQKPELVLEVGVKGILNVLDGCRINNVPELYIASTSEVYQSPPIIPTDETVSLVVPNALNPRYSYGGSKIITELLALNYGRNGFDKVVIFRPHNVYGPDMAWEHVLPQLISKASNLISMTSKDPVPFSIQGDGTQTRAFTHIDDMIEGLMILMSSGQHLNIYHIGNPEEITIQEVVDRIFGYFARTPKIIPSELPLGSTLRRCPNIDKMSALGFTPKIPFSVGLPPVIDWYLANSKPLKVKNETQRKVTFNRKKDISYTY